MDIPTRIHEAPGFIGLIGPEVLSTDPAHSLADALGVALTGEPTEVDTGRVAQTGVFDRLAGNLGGGH